MLRRDDSTSRLYGSAFGAHCSVLSSAVQSRPCPSVRAWLQASDEPGRRCHRAHPRRRQDYGLACGSSSRNSRRNSSCRQRDVRCLIVVGPETKKAWRQNVAGPTRLRWSQPAVYPPWRGPSSRPLTAREDNTTRVAHSRSTSRTLVPADIRFRSSVVPRFRGTTSGSGLPK